MFLRKLTVAIILCLAFLVQSAFCAENFKVKDLIIDSSDRAVFIRGIGNFKTIPQTASYVPIPTQNSNTVSLITDITTFKMTNPSRFVIDIPNAVLINSSRIYKIQNSSVLNNIQMSQFSITPNIVRIVFNVQKEADLAKFSVYTNGQDIVVKYKNQIIDNSIQYKFYTPSGDFDKTNGLQNTSSTLTFNANNETYDLTPRFQTKYYLSSISQNSDGLILRGLGTISMQRASYAPDNSKASIVLDNTSMNSKLENKTFEIPSTQKEIKATLTINRLNSRKVKLTLNGEALRDYRFVVSPDGQSIFVSHRTYIINTTFSPNIASISNYKYSKTSTNYNVFEINFDKAVTYDVFEMNGNFYLDINNLVDFNEGLFKQVFLDNNIKIQASKISGDKTRYIVPMDEMNFSYANIESNSKSIKLCFKDKPIEAPVVDISPKPETEEIIIATNTQNEEKKIEDKKAEEKKPQEPKVETKKENKIEGESTSGNINVVYIPKSEEIKGEKEKPKKKRENPTISSLKKVVIDPGHGGMDSGAIGGNYYEKELNLNVALLVKEKLEKKDIQVHMTRTKDTTLSLEDRVNFSNEINPDLFVSIHANSTLKEDTYGLETHYFKDNSIDLAQTIHGNFASNKNLKKWETIDRGVIKSRFYVINHTEAPSVLIEIGFISNLEERKKLLKENRQEEIASAIAKGILEYLKK